MDVIGELTGRLSAEVMPIIDWVLSDWIFMLLVLAALIYWAGRQQRGLRRHRL